MEKQKNLLKFLIPVLTYKEQLVNTQGIGNGLVLLLFVHVLLIGPDIGHMNRLYLPILLLRMLFLWVDPDRLMYIVEIESR